MNPAMQYEKFSSMLSAPLLAGVALLLATPLAAQSMDYGALEQLFKEPVTTSVNGSPQRVSNVPVAMEIVTAEDIRRSGARDIPGVLRHVVGIDILQWGADNTDISIRGYNQVYAARLLVLMHPSEQPTLRDCIGCEGMKAVDGFVG